MVSEKRVLLSRFARTRFQISDLYSNIYRNKKLLFDYREEENTAAKYYNIYALILQQLNQLIRRN